MVRGQRLHQSRGFGGLASVLSTGDQLADGVGGWDWLAISLLLLIGALTVALLWPYYNLTFRFDPEELLATYVDTTNPCR